MRRAALQAVVVVRGRQVPALRAEQGNPSPSPAPLSPMPAAAGVEEPKHPPREPVAAAVVAVAETMARHRLPERPTPVVVAVGATMHVPAQAGEAES